MQATDTLALYHETLWNAYAKLERTRTELAGMQIPAQAFATQEALLAAAQEAAQKRVTLETTIKRFEAMLVLLANAQLPYVLGTAQTLYDAAKEDLALAMAEYEQAVAARQQLLIELEQIPAQEKRTEVQTRAAQSLAAIHQAEEKQTQARMRQKMVAEYLQPRCLTGTLAEVLAWARGDVFCPLSPLALERVFSNGSATRRLEISYSPKTGQILSLT